MHVWQAITLLAIGVLIGILICAVNDTFNPGG